MRSSARSASCDAANGRRGDKDVYGNPTFGGLFRIHGQLQLDGGFLGHLPGHRRPSFARLVAAAAERWNVAPEAVQVQAGVLRGPAGMQATFAELSARAEQLPVPEGITPKAAGRLHADRQKARCTSTRRARSWATTQFTIDVALPGLLTAVVLHPPRFGTTAATIDDRAALPQVPGVVTVVPIAEGVAVVGETLDDAHRGVNALEVTCGMTERRATEL